MPIPHSHEIPAEMDICELLRTMNLTAQKADAGDLLPPLTDASDAQMVEDANYHSDATSERSTSSSSTEEHYGCAYLQAIRSQLENYPTTGGEYLEAIFTHREIMSAYPSHHSTCAIGFSDLAILLERRAWRADRESDAEAVAAFRHEAWHIAAILPRREPIATRSEKSTFVCVMPAMW